MIIALPEKDHSHLADALVRDLGFTRTHVDQPLRDLLLALDPFVDAGVTLANMGPSPRLSSKLEQAGGWDRLLHPPRPGSSPDRTAAEVARLLDALRKETNRVSVALDTDIDTVVLGTDIWGPGVHHAVAIEGRVDNADFDHWISPAGVVGEQEAIVAYVRSLREPVRVPTLVHVESDLPSVGPKEEWSFDPQTGESFVNGEPLPKDDVVLVMPDVSEGQPPQTVTKEGTAATPDATVAP